MSSRTNSVICTKRPHAFKILLHAVFETWGRDTKHARPGLGSNANIMKKHSCVVWEPRAKAKRGPHHAWVRAACCRQSRARASSPAGLQGGSIGGRSGSSGAPSSAVPGSVYFRDCCASSRPRYLYVMQRPGKKTGRHSHSPNKQNASSATNDYFSFRFVPIQFFTTSTANN